MDIKNQIEEAIAISESFLGLQRGDITWGVKTKKMAGEVYACAFFKLNDVEFINVMAVAESKNKSDQDFMVDFAYAQETAIRKVPSVLSVYGIVNMIETLGAKKMKLVYISDPDYVPSPGPTNTSWVSIN